MGQRLATAAYFCLCASSILVAPQALAQFEKLDSLIKVPLEFLGNLLSSREGKLKSLLDEGKTDEAAKFHSDNRDFFREKAEANKALLQRLRDVLGKPHDSRMAGLAGTLRPYAAEPAPASQWPSLREALSEARKAIAAYVAMPALADAPAPSSEFTRLERMVADVTATQRRAAPAAYASFDHFGPSPITALYPVALQEGDIRAGHESIRRDLESKGSQEIARYREHYQDKLDESQRSALAAAASRAYFRELAPGGLVTMQVALKLVAEAAAGRLDLASLPVRIGAIWLGDGAESGDFPVRANMPRGLALESAKAAGLSAAMAGLDFALIVDTHRPAALRQTRSVRSERSRYKASERDVPNPAYQEATDNYRRMERELQSLRNSNDQLQSQARSNVSMGGLAGMAGLLGATFGQGVMFKAESDMRDARNLMESTPRSTREDVMADYQYAVADIEVTRRLLQTVYLVDLKSRNVMKRGLRSDETRRFSLAEGLDRRDPDLPRLERNYASGGAVDAYAAAALVLDLAALINSLLQAGQDSWATDSLGHLAAAIDGERDRYLAELRNEQDRLGQAERDSRQRVAAITAPPAVAPAAAPTLAALPGATGPGASQACIGDIQRALSEMRSLYRESKRNAYAMNSVDNDMVYKDGDCSGSVAAGNQRQAQDATASLYACGIKQSICAIDRSRSGTPCAQAVDACRREFPLPVVR